MNMLEIFLTIHLQQRANLQLQLLGSDRNLETQKCDSLSSRLSVSERLYRTYNSSCSRVKYFCKLFSVRNRLPTDIEPSTILPKNKSSTAISPKLPKVISSKIVLRKFSPNFPWWECAIVLLNHGSIVNSFSILCSMIVLLNHGSIENSFSILCSMTS